MASELLVRQRIVYAENAFAEIVIWKVDPKVRGSSHGFKYRLAFVVDGICVIRYDNEAGKGDHKHFGSAELPITFAGTAALLETFFSEVDQWLHG